MPKLEAIEKICNSNVAKNVLIFDECSDWLLIFICESTKSFELPLFCMTKPRMPGKSSLGLASFQM